MRKLPSCPLEERPIVCEAGELDLTSLLNGLQAEFLVWWAVETLL